MVKILIDTDVILDFFFDRQPFSEEAAQILSLCEDKKLSGFITPVMMSNIYYILRKTAGHDKVIGSLKALIKIVDIVDINRKTILDALNSDFKDFEDALQNFSAQDEKDIKIIITRNIKHYKTSSLSIMTPETFLKTI
ncbi:PIN domain-containing protein [Elizabethkingia meningoseptica]|uniref:PIN domain-containing protein n=1 Tax=Elizabethkingia meningoseptica TaxID=238 RepID=UPI002DD648CB|nr:PIN domain-containing protein [Elizabethkingia meningoseptica]MEC4711231.1 PIN domain-containing protein [Elizabethkingia meningoseptica]